MQSLFQGPTVHEKNLDPPCVTINIIFSQILDAPGNPRGEKCLKWVKVISFGEEVVGLSLVSNLHISMPLLVTIVLILAWVT